MNHIPDRHHVEANGLTIYAESFGFPDDPTLLLISGLGGQLTGYSDEVCAAFVDRGFFVIRMDNRDVGLSSKFEEGSQYTLSEMASDCVAVLQHLEATPAHIFGFSMGGMIAQVLAVEHGDIVSSLISAGSTTGSPDFGRGTDEAIRALMLPEATTREEFIDLRLQGKRIWGTPDTWNEEEFSEQMGKDWDRAQSPGAGRRQFAAIGSSGNREDDLRKLSMPTLVIHGGIDPLITPSGGERTAAVIPNARYEEIEGMGHDIPITELPHVVALVTNHVAQTETA